MGIILAAHCQDSTGVWNYWGDRLIRSVDSQRCLSSVSSDVYKGFRSIMRGWFVGVHKLRREIGISLESKTKIYIDRILKRKLLTIFIQEENFTTLFTSKFIKKKIEFGIFEVMLSKELRNMGNEVVHKKDSFTYCPSEKIMHVQLTCMEVGTCAHRF